MTSFSGILLNFDLKGSLELQTFRLMRGKFCNLFTLDDGRVLDDRKWLRSAVNGQH
jgi:hypothetical protein